MPEKTKPSLELILVLTAFAAGSMDVIAFSKLGGILVSAMTGNLAFLGYYISRFSFDSAIGSAIALVGYVLGGVIGTLLSRKLGQHPALRLLLTVQALLIAAAVTIWFAAPHRNGNPGTDAVIVLGAVAMGIQSIVGKRVNLSNIPTVVFTSTLTNIVIALTEMLVSGKFAVPKDTKRQVASFLMYFFGALGTGYAVFFGLPFFGFIPLAAVVLALLSELLHRG
ncbi:YoaK family protein [Acidocella sp.]|jgi:uncharacterized membrane protein YoaK (UPF0700 family)|uniref:YoaK family protein n=1 Tax=Acidocella sp. TaxID=50710 RepID=UPI002F42CDE0